MESTLDISTTIVLNRRKVYFPLRAYPKSHNGML